MVKKLYFASIIFTVLITLSFIKISANDVNYSVHKIKFINNRPIKNIVNRFYPQEKEIARIKIPQINVDKPLYNINSELNTVDKNITILKGSIFPDKKNSIMFIAAHSGNGKLAYFKDLNKLNVNSLIYIYYNNYMYIYKNINTFTEDKDGDIEINKKYDKELILTTCDPNHNNKQLILENILIKRENIIN